MPTIEPQRTLALSKIALQVATEASRLVLSRFRTDQKVTLKDDGEPVTEADVASEALVRERLQQLTPEIPVIGEEGGGEPADGLTWYCDPIDGTINFMRGQPYFAVSLGIAVGREPVAGAVVAPALRLWWRGGVGDRAFRNEVPCRVSNVSELREAVVTTGLPARGRPPARAGLGVLGAISQRARDLRRCGSAAIELCMVADGSYDAYLSPRLAPWDTCAGAAILLAAGGGWRTLPDPEPDASDPGRPDAGRTPPAFGERALGELEVGDNVALRSALNGLLERQGSG